jgi:hypothetical protein
LSFQYSRFEQRKKGGEADLTLHSPVVPWKPLLPACLNSGMTGTWRRAEGPEPLTSWGLSRLATSVAQFVLDYRYKIDSLQLGFAPLPVHILLPRYSTR